MEIGIDEKDIKRIVLVSDKVLVKPKNPQQRTKSGLYLPPAAVDKEKVLTGYVIKAGPGFPIPAMTAEEEEKWKGHKKEVKYVPLQASPGDLAVYLNNSGYEIEFNKKKYVILSHSSILMLVRDEGLFE